MCSSTFDELLRVVLFIPASNLETQLIQYTPAAGNLWLEILTLLRLASLGSGINISLFVV